MPLSAHLWQSPVKPEGAVCTGFLSRPRAERWIRDAVVASIVREVVRNVYPNGARAHLLELRDRGVVENLRVLILVQTQQPSNHSYAEVSCMEDACAPPSSKAAILLKTTFF